MMTQLNAEQKGVNVADTSIGFDNLNMDVMIPDTLWSSTKTDVAANLS